MPVHHFPWLSPPSPMLRKSIVAVGFVVIVPWSFFATLIREMLSAFWYAWNTALQEIASGIDIWHGRER